MPLAELLADLLLIAQEGGQGAPSAPESGGASAPLPWILIAVVVLIVALGGVAVLRRLR